LNGTAVVSALDVPEESGMEESSRMELDSHDNMPVVGRNADIYLIQGELPDYESMMIPIVDAAVLYQSPYDRKLYNLVIRNDLRAPSMQNNLVPSFVLREAGIRVKDTPKNQTIEPTEEDHSMYFPETDFQIPLSLWGMFLYFVTQSGQPY
jgi:hypothetical protein